MKELKPSEIAYLEAIIVSDIKEHKELIEGSNEHLANLLKQDIQDRHELLKKIVGVNEDVCEICHEPFFKWCEGTEPHTCCSCMPKGDNE